MILLSCNSSLTKDEYIHWVKDVDNGLHVIAEQSDLIIELQYQPADYLLLQRNYVSKDFHKTNDSILAEIDNMQHYLLTIRTKSNTPIENFNVTNQDQKQRKLYYLSYLFQHDISLRDNDDTHPCVLYHFEKPADLSYSRTFVLGFENSNQNSTEATVTIVSEHFGSLPINIKVSKANIPKLKI